MTGYDRSTEDLRFAAACMAGEAAALDELHRVHLADAVAAVASSYRDRELADEVRQQVATWLLVDGGLQTYAGRGSLRAWLRVVALREASRLSSKRKELPADDATLFDRAVGVEDHELLRRKEAYRLVFRNAFNAAVSALSIHDRLLLRQHFLDGLTLDELATLHRVHRATAARQLAKIRDKLLAQTRKAFQAELAIDERDFTELLDLIASRLDASISRLLG